MAFKLSAGLVAKAVSLLWTLGWALRDGELTDEEMAAIGAKVGELVKVLEEAL